MKTLFSKYNAIPKKDLLILFGSVIVVLFSFFTYAPYFFVGFNSDHAIHVLMSYKFTWPHDVYYWGQNRLGSFFPLIASSFIKLLPTIHPLFICSLVQYAMLLVPTLIITSFLKSNWLKLLLFFFIFLPMNEFHVLLLLGHPYLSQYFCGVLFIYFGYLYLKHVNNPNKTILSGFYLIASVLFFTFSVWISESSAIFILIPVYYFLPPLKPLKKYLLELSRISFLALIFCLIPCIVILLIKSYHLKGQIGQYDTLFFFKPKQILEQLDMFWNKIIDTFTFRDGKIIEDLFYYCLGGFLIWMALIKKEKHTKFISALLVTALFAFIFLFFANWNLINKIPPRFYIPVYLLLICALLFYIEIMQHAKFELSFSLVFIALSIVFQFYNKSIIRHLDSSAMKSFSDFRKLSKGTLIGDYWQVHVINAVACKNLSSIAYDGQYVRNRAIMGKALTASRFYFINDSKFQALLKDDMIRQFDKTFYFSGQKVNCNGLEVWVFGK